MANLRSCTKPLDALCSGVTRRSHREVRGPFSSLPRCAVSKLRSPRATEKSQNSMHRSGIRKRFYSMKAPRVSDLHGRPDANPIHDARKGHRGVRKRLHSITRRSQSCSNPTEGLPQIQSTKARKGHRQVSFSYDDSSTPDPRALDEFRKSTSFRSELLLRSSKNYRGRPA